jgi:hypothetical protein
MIYNQDRELCREKFIKMLPQNLTEQADMGKSFGGKNALDHIINKKKVLGSQISTVTETKHKYMSITKNGFLNKDISFPIKKNE